MSKPIANAPDDLRDQHLAKMRSAARELRELTATINGAPAEPDSIESPETELGLRLGKAGKAGSIYPLALTLPALAGPNGDAVADAVSRASVEPLFERITQGWTDSTPSNSTQHYLGVETTSDSEFESLIRSLAARVARYDGTTIAGLAFGKLTLVSPSVSAEGAYTLGAGERGRLTLLTPAELFGVSVVIDELSDERDRLARGWYDIREHDQRTNAVRDRFNRQTPAADAIRILLDGGWAQGETTKQVATFTRGTASGQLVLGPRAFIVADEPGATLAGSAAVYRPFDLLAAFPNDEGLDSPEKLATWLVDEGHVAAEIDVFSARGERPEIEENQSSTTVISEFADALRQARSRTDASMPLVFSQQVEGIAAGIISVAPSGQVRRWDERTAPSLLLAAAQPVHVTETKRGPAIAFRHSIPPALVQAVLMTLDSPGVLAPVEHVATEPLLVKSGKVAQLPGYDRSAKAVIAIPHRDRARWAREYSVPERPTLEEAQAAYEFLNLELLSDFAHETKTDRARHMAYLLTCVGRPLTNGSIGFLANARDRGTGKSLALLIGRLLAQGHPGSLGFRVGGWADEETAKLLGSLLNEQGRFFHCDEVPRGGKITGLTITELVTAIDGEKKVRLLGGKDTVTQSGVILTLAGNAVELGGDANRRYLTINLAWMGGGSPISRTGFRHSNIVGFINQSRPQLLAAAHTILLFGLQNDAPREIPGMGFTHDWPAKILGAMSHLTGADGRDLLTIALEGWEDEVAAADPIGEDWGELLANLWATRGDKLSTAGQLRDAGTLPPYPDGPVPRLPSGLLGLRDVAEADANRKWGEQIALIRGTTVPFEGVNYRVVASDRKTKSKKALTYVMEAFGPDHKPLVPGQPLPKVESETEKPVAEEPKPVETVEPNELTGPPAPHQTISVNVGGVELSAEDLVFW